MIKVSLGILSDLDFDFWIKSNDYYSPDIFSTNVKTGFNHAKKAGLIGEFEKRIICNLDLINIIDERINLVNVPESYSDNDLLIIFDPIRLGVVPLEGIHMYFKMVHESSSGIILRNTELPCKCSINLMRNQL